MRGQPAAPVWGWPFARASSRRMADAFAPTAMARARVPWSASLSHVRATDRALRADEVDRARSGGVQVVAAVVEQDRVDAGIDDGGGQPQRDRVVARAVDLVDGEHRVDIDLDVVAAAE